MCVFNINIDSMRKSGRVLSNTLKYLEDTVVKPGVSTLYVSKMAEMFILGNAGCFPAFLGYHGFPESVCTSINTRAVHGVPSDTEILAEGDIISVDCGVVYKGMYTDACRTLAVGEVSTLKTRLIQAAEAALTAGIEKCVGGNRIGDVSYAIQHTVELSGFVSSYEFTGHGIGSNLHQLPQIPNIGVPDTGKLIQTGFAFAIEPVIFNGTCKTILNEDGWSVDSPNGILSAHVEDTVFVSASGAEILTR